MTNKEYKKYIESKAWSINDMGEEDISFVVGVLDKANTAWNSDTAVEDFILNMIVAVEKVERRVKEGQLASTLRLHASTQDGTTGLTRIRLIIEVFSQVDNRRYLSGNSKYVGYITATFEKNQLVLVPSGVLEGAIKEKRIPISTSPNKSFHRREKVCTLDPVHTPVTKQLAFNLEK